MELESTDRLKWYPDVLCYEPEETNKYCEIQGPELDYLFLNATILILLEEHLRPSTSGPWACDSSSINGMPLPSVSIHILIEWENEIIRSVQNVNFSNYGSFVVYVH